MKRIEREEEYMMPQIYTVAVFVAEDGTEFYTEKDCLKHELYCTSINNLVCRIIDAYGGQDWSEDRKKFLEGTLKGMNSNEQGIITGLLEIIERN